MEHREATEEILRLIPKMANQDPGEVLIEHASRHKLAPAQLHKLAQVYNTCSTLYGQSVNRNAIPDLVDGADVVRKFAERHGRSQQKAASSFMSDAPAEPLEKAASAEPVAEQPEELPHIWSEAPLKRAAAEREIDPTLKRDWFFRDYDRTIRKTIAGVEKMAAAMDSLAQTRDNAVAAINSAINKGAGEDLVARMERDANTLMDTPLSRTTFDLIEGSAKAAGVKCIRWSEEKYPSLVLGRDSTGLFNKINDVSENFFKTASVMTEFEEDLATCMKMASEAPKGYEARALNMLESLKRAAAPLEEFFKFASAAEKEDTPKKKPSTTRTTSLGVEEAIKENEGAIRRMRGFDPAKDTGEFRDAAEDAAAGYITIPAALMKDVVHGVGGAFSGIAGGATELASPTGGLAKFLSPYGDEYKGRQQADQLSLDKSEIDTISIANLKRLMATDEIISLADPAAVVEAFNSIRNASLEVAADPSLLRLQLRQALQLQGFDIDSATAARKFDRGAKVKSDTKENA